MYCSKLKVLTFEKGSRVREVGKSAFYETCIMEIVFPKSVEILKAKCLERTFGMKSVKFERGSRLKVIEKYCFVQCYMPEIVIPKSVEVLENSCFSRATKLNKVVFEKGSRLKSIGVDIFTSANRLNVNEIEFPIPVDLAKLKYY
jgi:hypothetical protein